MPELQRLKEDEAVRREITLNSIEEQRFILLRDLGCPFTLHEIKGTPDVAVHGLAAGSPTDYLRAYTLPVVDEYDGYERLFIDDLLSEDDVVNFDQEIFWHQDKSRWETRDTIVRGDDAQAED